jgi:ribosomal protein L37AE/L43A
MNTSSKTSSDLVDRISAEYIDFKFKMGRQEHWSPKTQTITYNPEEPFEKFSFGLLHELAHAVLGHSTYGSDFELLKLEGEAWSLAAKLGKRYGVSISEDHIQNCLDTYRDWLHRRSACPKCGIHTLQKDSSSYQCYNCQSVWQVSSGRFVRPYRKTQV